MLPTPSSFLDIGGEFQKWKQFPVKLRVPTRHTFKMAIWWNRLVDESIRWLWGQGRNKEALEIASKAIEKNGKYFVDYKNQPNPNQEQDKAYDSRVSQSSESTTNTEEMSPPRAGVLDLFRHRNLRNRTFIMAYMWFANSLGYYGLAFNIGTLPGNPFLMSFLNGLAELPGYVIVVGLLDRTGRRSLESTLLFIGGFACIVIAFIPHGKYTVLILMTYRTIIQKLLEFYKLYFNS